MCHATRRMIGLEMMGRAIGDFGIGPIVPHAGYPMHGLEPVVEAAARRQPAAPTDSSGTVTSTTAAASALTRSAGARWRLTPCAPPPIATRSNPDADASTMTGQPRVAPNGVI